MKTLFETVRDAGIPYASHYSDLYVPDTEAVRAILNGYPDQRDGALLTRFWNRAEGGWWLDLPFMFDPYWDNVLEVAR